MADNKQKKSWKELFDKHAESKGKTKIGDYQEAAGGGTPMKKGQKVSYVADTVEEAHQYRKDHPGSIVRVNQPRDEEGHFTYNSANERELEYGPSRGKTIPPFLKGMEISFAKKSGQGSIIMDGKRYKPLVAFKSAAELVQMFKEYSKKEDSFVGGLGEGFGAMSNSAKGMGGTVGKNKTTIDKEYIVPAFKATAKFTKKHGVSGAKTYFSKKSAAPAPAPTEKKTEAPVEEESAMGPKSPNYSLAKTDKEKFVEDNAREISDLIKLADEKGYALDVNELVEAIASEEFADFEEIRKLIEEE